jgi:signal transduction histidine kinase
MSYRAFKRLLGETSLERKCRFLFGAGILVLITISFWVYAVQNEELAYNQAGTTCRLLVNPILVKQHLAHLESIQYKHLEGKLLERAWNLNESSGPPGETGTQGKDPEDRLGSVPEYQYYFLQEGKFDDPYERDLYKDFTRKDKPKSEAMRFVSGAPKLRYYAAIRAGKACLSCHQTIAKVKNQPELAEDDLMAIVRITLDTRAIADAVHVNRAFLISIALVTALLIMAGSWIIVRYVIVKPVKHLKEVSDAIAAGELNVRSEIQTGDEFEDLSHAFNRMLRNLVGMQDRWRKVNTDLDRKVDELARANMALYESNRLKSDFMSTMSHELRTPLNSILGFSEVLLSSNLLSDKQQRWVGNIQSSGQRLLNLINDILDLAKIEAGKMEVRLEEFSIHDVCEGLLGMFRPLAEKKNIDMRSQVAPDIPRLRQDPTKLQQILQNLLSNAIKFTPEGGRVLLKAEADAGHLVLTVTDTGVGIAPEEQELVFEKFRQSGNPLTREHAGTGLGLSIVRELSKLLGGEVTLQSELGRGSIFTVRLPLQLSDEPRLEFDLAHDNISLSHARRVDVRLLGSGTTPVTKVDLHTKTQVDVTPADTPSAAVVTPAGSASPAGPDTPPPTADGSAAPG